MAQNRLTKVASIFTRMSGLLKSNLVKETEKPMWYDIYKAFPPARDPVYRSAAGLLPNQLPPLPPKILYPEDIIRSQFFKEMSSNEVQVLGSDLCKPIWEIYTQVYIELTNRGEIEEDKLVQATIDELTNRGYSVNRKRQSEQKDTDVESNEEFLSILGEAIGAKTI